MNNLDTQKIKKVMTIAIPSVIVFIICSYFSCSYRTAIGIDILDKFSSFIDNLSTFYSFQHFNIIDFLIGIVGALAFQVFLYFRKKNKKKFYEDEEYGNARWGNEKDIKPYMNPVFEKNILLTNTERLNMERPSNPKYNRNRNVLLVGTTGSGKTRFYFKPQLMQMNASYVLTDPKGSVINECGAMLQRGKPIYKNGKLVGYKPYKIKVFNTNDFTKSMHYNPFAYIRPDHREVDIAIIVESLIANTSGKGAPGDDFWIKAEKMLYMSYIALIMIMCPKEEWNFETLIEFINASECSDDENFKNAIDWAFYYLEKWINNDWDENEQFDEATENYRQLMDIEVDEWRAKLGRFALRQYDAYKLASDKTAKSILISCSARLSAFSIDELLEITQYDELEIDTYGDELSALFVITPDTDTTFNFIVAILFTQIFRVLINKADSNPKKHCQLNIPVRCLIDEFYNITQIPEFDKIINVIRSRNIDASLGLQSESQLKVLYKDKAETIKNGCDSVLFLGGREKTTLKDLSDDLGSETIHMYNTSKTKGQSESYGVNHQKLGKKLKSVDELQVLDNDYCILQLRGVRPFLSKKFDIEKHKNYKLLFDYDTKYYFDLDKFISDEKNHKATLRTSTKVEQYVAKQQ